VALAADAVWCAAGVTAVVLLVASKTTTSVRPTIASAVAIRVLRDKSRMTPPLVPIA
jgi:hypothetical protein